MSLRRYGLSIAVAAMVTIGLFYLMQYLIAHGGGERRDPVTGRVLDFVQPPEESEVRTKERRKPDKPPPPEQPPEPPPLQLANSRPDMSAVDVGNLNFNTGFDGLDGGLAAIGPSEDGEALPLVRIEPQYPRRAMSRGIEGWVQLQFSISKTGTVIDPQVVDSHPSSIFNREAIRAVRKWKYKPKIVNGQPVERHGVQVVLTFQLTN